MLELLFTTIVVTGAAVGVVKIVDKVKKKSPKQQKPVKK